MPADIPALSAVAARSYRTAFASILEEDVLATRDSHYFADRFAGCWERVTVAVEENAIIGFLLLTDDHIDMLFLDPSQSGKGLGARLLAHAERKGARSLECFRDNHRARRFYERHGWELERAYDSDFAGRPRSFVLYVKGRRGTD